MEFESGDRSGSGGVSESVFCCGSSYQLVHLIAIESIQMKAVGSRTG